RHPPLSPLSLHDALPIFLAQPPQQPSKILSLVRGDTTQWTLLILCNAALPGAVRLVRRTVVFLGAADSALECSHQSRVVFDLLLVVLHVLRNRGRLDELGGEVGLRLAARQRRPLTGPRRGRERIGVVQ